MRTKVFAERLWTLFDAVEVHTIPKRCSEFILGAFGHSPPLSRQIQFAVVLLTSYLLSSTIVYSSVLINYFLAGANAENPSRFFANILHPIPSMLPAVLTVVAITRRGRFCTVLEIAALLAWGLAMLAGGLLSGHLFRSPVELLLILSYCLVGMILCLRKRHFIFAMFVLALCFLYFVGVNNPVLTTRGIQLPTLLLVNGCLDFLTLIATLKILDRIRNSHWVLAPAWISLDMLIGAILWIVAFYSIYAMVISFGLVWFPHQPPGTTFLEQLSCLDIVGELRSLIMPSRNLHSPYAALAATTLIPTFALWCIMTVSVIGSVLVSMVRGFSDRVFTATSGRKHGAPFKALACTIAVVIAIVRFALYLTT